MSPAVPLPGPPSQLPLPERTRVLTTATIVVTQQPLSLPTLQFGLTVMKIKKANLVLKDKKNVSILLMCC